MNRNKLKENLDNLGINPIVYNLDGSISNPGTVLFYNYGKWEIIDVGDKGEQTIIKVFLTEDEACQFILNEFIKYKNISSVNVKSTYTKRKNDTNNLPDMIIL